MKLKRWSMVRALCLLLCLASCLLTAPGCKKTGGSTLANNDFVSLTPDKDQLKAVVTANNRVIDQHKGEKLYLYEMLPGEDLAAALAREPVDEKKISSHMEFSFPMMDGERTRMYSSFIPAFADGTALLPNGYFVDQPTRAATDKSPFLWPGSQKGLCAANVEEALALGTMHTMYEISLAKLISGPDTFFFAGTPYSVSNTELASLDALILPAADAGMQVSLLLTPDAELGDAAAAAVCDLLCARYTGKISMVVIGDAEGRTPQSAARLCRYASLALYSRMANARLYLLSPQGSVTSVNAFYHETVLALSPGGVPSWNAMLAPMLVPENVEASEVMTPADISKASDYVLNEIGVGRAERTAVYLPNFSSKNPELQAAQFAYAYRLSLAAGVGLIYYGSLYDDNTGLYSSTGARRIAADIFETIDIGLSYELDNICRETVGEPWDYIQTPTLITRELVTGNANVGTVGFPEEPLFDFTAGDTLGFIGASSYSAPTVQNSAHWNKPVLYTWLDPTHEYPTGVRKLLPNSEELTGATSLSIDLLTQAKITDTVNVRLGMEGTTTTGSRITYESSVKVENGKWQVVTFQISSFVTSLDSTKPCTITLTAEPESETADPFVLWVHGIDIRRPEVAKTSSAILGIILGGVSLTFALVFSIYIVSAKRHKKP